MESNLIIEHFDDLIECVQDKARRLGGYGDNDGYNKFMRLSSLLSAERMTHIVIEKQKAAKAEKKLTTSTEQPTTKVSPECIGFRHQPDPRPKRKHEFAHTYEPKERVEFLMGGF